jgi:HTH-type transcriptional regulator, sugar sensing transcriptional regulator
VTRERDEAIGRLRELGLNQLEAETYAYLLPHEPATAYAIGRAIGRPTANVYKAVERLARIGAVLVEEGDSRVCRAVPVREFIAHTERAFSGRTQAARQALSRLEKESFDERVYRIESVAEVLARAGEMLARARTVAVVDAFPRVLGELADALARTARRGVQVVVEAYVPTEIEGADIVVVPEGERSLEAWHSEQLNIVVDGREHLLALLSEDLREVHQAVWSRSLYLSCLHHAGRMSEITVIRMMNENAGAERRRRRATLDRHPFFRNSEVPGHRELLQRFARPASAEKETHKKRRGR